MRKPKHGEQVHLYIDGTPQVIEPGDDSKRLWNLVGMAGVQWMVSADRIERLCRQVGRVEWSEKGDKQEDLF